MADTFKEQLIKLIKNDSYTAALHFLAASEAVSIYLLEPNMSGKYVKSRQFMEHVVKPESQKTSHVRETKAGGKKH